MSEECEDLIDELYPPFEMTYEEFYTKYLEANKPCILRNYLNDKNWRASTDWVKEGEPCVQNLIEIFPSNLQVPVSLCDSQYFNSQECITQTLEEFYQYWRSDREDSRYLKDWHFVSDCKTYLPESDYGEKAYKIPLYFMSDWLNEWLDFRELKDDEKRTDYKFVYIGPKGSFTPFHSDVFGSFSWSANIVGIKEWIFLPPGEEQKVEIREGTYVYDIFDNQSKELQEKKGKVRLVKVEQRSGDLVFVPSGWYHQVRNIVDTISINHNWFNAANIQAVYRNLNLELNRVEKEISDCRKDPSWNYLCQSLLREHFGLNHLQLLQLLEDIVHRRLDSQNPGCESMNGKEGDYFNLGMNGEDLINLEIQKQKDMTAAHRILIQLREKLDSRGLVEETKRCENVIKSIDEFQNT